MQRNERVVTVCLLYPLHAVAGIGEDFFAGTPDILRSLGVVGKSSLIASALHPFSVVSIIIDKVYRPQRAVLFYFTNDTTNAIAIVGVILLVEGYTVVADGEELSALAGVPSHTLVHDGNEVMGNIFTIGLGKALGHLQVREEHLRRAPQIAIR